MKINKRMNNKKTPRTANKSNPYDENEESNLKRNDFPVNDNNFENPKDEEEDEENKEYCLPDCLLGKRYDKNIVMIGCDGCDNWYHLKCLNMTEEELNKDYKDKEWYCVNCQNNSNK
jgi:hypothetical protein